MNENKIKEYDSCIELYNNLKNIVLKIKKSMLNSDICKIDGFVRDLNLYNIEIEQVEEKIEHIIKEINKNNDNEIEITKNEINKEVDNLNIELRYIQGDYKDNVDIYNVYSNCKFVYSFICTEQAIKDFEKKISNYYKKGILQDDIYFIKQKPQIEIDPAIEYLKEPYKGKYQGIKKLYFPSIFDN